MFTTDPEGFQIAFPNKVSGASAVTVSVQFGPEHYCANQGELGQKIPEVLSCATAEIAIWQENRPGYLTRNFLKEIGEPHTEYQDVVGWCSSDIALQAFSWAKSFGIRFACYKRNEESGLYVLDPVESSGGIEKLADIYNIPKEVSLESIDAVLDLWAQEAAAESGTIELIDKN